MATMAAGLVTSTSCLCFSTHRQDFPGSAPSQIPFWKSGITNSLCSRGLPAPRLRRCRSVRAAQSSTQSENAADENLAITKQRLRELSESLVLPANYLERLPNDLRVDLKDAGFALSSGALNDECGEQAGDLLMQLSRACERGETQAAASCAEQLLLLVDKLPNKSSSQFVGRRFIRAGRYFSATGQFAGGELQKIGKAFIAAGEAMSGGNLPVTETKISSTKEFKFGDLQVEITAQRAYIGAAVSLVFGVLSWQLTTGLQNQADSSLQYANDNAVLLATSLRGTLLAAGFFSAALSACIAVGLLVLATSFEPEKK